MKFPEEFLEKFWEAFHEKSQRKTFGRNFYHISGVCPSEIVEEIHDGIHVRTLPLNP